VCGLFLHQETRENTSSQNSDFLDDLCHRGCEPRFPYKNVANRFLLADGLLTGLQLVAQKISFICKLFSEFTREFLTTLLILNIIRNSKYNSSLLTLSDNECGIQSVNGLLSILQVTQYEATSSIQNFRNDCRLKVPATQSHHRERVVRACRFATSSVSL